MDQQAVSPLSGVGAERGEVVELDRGVWRRAWESLRHDKMAIFGGFVVLAFVLLAIFAPFLAPHDPTQQFSDGLSAQGAPLPPGGTAGESHGSFQRGGGREFRAPTVRRRRRGARPWRTARGRPG